MTQTTTRYTISAAHRITGRSRTTIQRHVKRGKLSFTEDPDGNKLIDASELIRVYGDNCDFTVEEEKPSREEGPPVQHELHTLQQRVGSLEEERRREREQLQAQIDHLQESLKLAQEGHNRATLLLEDRSGAGEWREAIQALETTLAEQEVAREEAERAVESDYRNHPWWRLFAT